MGQGAAPVGPVALAGIAGAAVVFTVALTFATLELPRWLTALADPWIEIPDYHPAIEPAAIEAFLETSLVRPIGYGSLALILVLIVAGILTRRLGLATAGAVALFLPTFGYFAGYMFFLAGLGVLRVVYLPAWAAWMALGDVAYVPYMALVWPAWLVGLDLRWVVVVGAIGAGLLLFTVATAAWLLARAEGRTIADFWVYRWSRHPQYAGWILWSWGLMLLAGLQPVPMAGENPGAALPWLISTVVIVAVAWGEEGAMLRAHGEAYAAYRRRTPFLFPLPGRVGRLLGAPLRLVVRADPPGSGREILAGAAVYLALALLLSLPFVLLDWPPYDWWSWPGFGGPFRW